MYTAMKYALLVHVNKEAVDQPNAKVAGMAYGEALRAAGIFVAGAGLGHRRRPLRYRSETENARCMTAHMLSRRNSSAGLSSSMCQIWMLHWSGQRVIPLRRTHSSKCVQ